MELLNKKQIKELTEKYPLYSQDGKQGNAKVLHHFFIGSADWYVLEGSKEGTTPDGKDIITLYGIVSLHEIEFGYFSLSEMESIKIPQRIKDEKGNVFTINVEIERDKYFKPTLIKNLKTNERIDDFLKRYGYKK